MIRCHGLSRETLSRPSNRIVLYLIFGSILLMGVTGCLFDPRTWLADQPAETATWRGVISEVEVEVVPRFSNEGSRYTVLAITLLDGPPLGFDINIGKESQSTVEYPFKVLLADNEMRCIPSEGRGIRRKIEIHGKLYFGTPEGPGKTDGPVVRTQNVANDPDPGLVLKVDKRKLHKLLAPSQGQSQNVEPPANRSGDNDKIE